MQWNRFSEHTITFALNNKRTEDVYGSEFRLHDWQERKKSPKSLLPFIVWQKLYFISNLNACE